SQIRVTKILEKIADARRGPIGARGGRTVAPCLLVGLLSPMNNSPDAPAGAIAAGVGQRHLVMTDDAIVKVGDVQGPIRTKLDVDRAKPRIIRLKKSLKDAFWTGPVPFDGELIDAAANDIADIGAVAPGPRIMVGGVIGDAGHGGRFRVTGVHLWAE